MKHFKSITLRILALLLCLSAVVPLSAQVMHAIIFADTKDPSVGACDLQDYYRVSVEMSTIASATGMQLKLSRATICCL